MSRTYSLSAVLSFLAPSRRLWHALLDVDDYLRGQSSWLVNYAKRYRADLRVGTSITEGTTNFRVNRRVSVGIRRQLEGTGSVTSRAVCDEARCLNALIMRSA